MQIIFRNFSKKSIIRTSHLHLTPKKSIALINECEFIYKNSEYRTHFEEFIDLSIKTPKKVTDKLLITKICKKYYTQKFNNILSVSKFNIPGVLIYFNRYYFLKRGVISKLDLMILLEIHLHCSYHKFEWKESPIFVPNSKTFYRDIHEIVFLNQPKYKDDIIFLFALNLLAIRTKIPINLRAKLREVFSDIPLDISIDFDELWDQSLLSVEKFDEFQDELQTLFDFEGKRIKLIIKNNKTEENKESLKEIVSFGRFCRRLNIKVPEEIISFENNLN